MKELRALAKAYAFARTMQKPEASAFILEFLFSEAEERGFEVRDGFDVTNDEEMGFYNSEDPQEWWDWFLGIYTEITPPAPSVPEGLRLFVRREK